MNLWRPAAAGVWQGRDDSAEGPEARRLFQRATVADSFTPARWPGHIALLGFACDEGVRRNHGRPGAGEGPQALRRALANMASRDGGRRWVDMGNIHGEPGDLEAAQQVLRDAVLACQRSQMRTLAIGGGHETAYGHGLGVLDAFPDERIAIINFDAHFDLRDAPQATSGTPFRQLAQACEAQGRAFSYHCFGISPAANTGALWAEARRRGAQVVDDLACCHQLQQQVLPALERIVANHDRLYLSIDLDVLPGWEMPAVSAPAAPGVPLATLLRMTTPLCASGKLQAADLVEFNPQYDRDNLAARVAARLAWQILDGWRW